MTVRAKVLLYFFAPALVILGVLAALLLSVNDRTAEALAGERNGEIANLLADQLAAELRGYVDILDAVAARPEVYRFEPAAQQLALRMLVGQLRPFDQGVVLLDQAGRVTAADARQPGAPGQNWSGYNFVRRALAAQGPVVISDVEQLPTGAQVVAIALPVRAPRVGFPGLIVGLFSVDSGAASGLRDAVAGLPIGAQRQITVLDGAGGRISGDMSAVYGEQVLQTVRWMHTKVTRLRPGNGGEELLVAVAPVPETGWQLVLAEPWGNLAGAYLGLTRLFLGLLLLGLLLTAVVVAVGVERLLRPVSALTTAVQRAAAGGLGQQVSVHTGDELEVLAEQFNLMSSQLAASYAELEARVAERTREINALYEQAKETATLAERNRLARELHDSVTQTLFSAKLIADVLPRLWERDPLLAQAKVADLKSLTGGALAEMRTLLVELRPTALVESDLAELLQNLAGAAQVRNSAAIEVHAVKGARLPPEVQETFYRVAQEALNNALKHSQAGCIRITYALQQEARVIARLEVADDGAGMDVAMARGAGHLGLRIMAERASGVGAHLVIDAAPGCGARVLLSWEGPLNPELAFGSS